MDIIEEIQNNEETKSIRGLRAKLPIYNDACELSKEEIEEILNNIEGGFDDPCTKEKNKKFAERAVKEAEEVIENKDHASPAQLQKEARKRVIDKILKWDPTYVERRKEGKKKLDECFKNFKKQERSFYNTGDWVKLISSFTQ